MTVRCFKRKGDGRKRCWPMVRFGFPASWKPVPSGLDSLNWWQLFFKTDSFQRFKSGPVSLHKSAGLSENEVYKILIPEVRMWFGFLNCLLCAQPLCNFINKRRKYVGRWPMRCKEMTSGDVAIACLCRTPDVWFVYVGRSLTELEDLQHLAPRLLLEWVIKSRIRRISCLCFIQSRLRL